MVEVTKSVHSNGTLSGSNHTGKSNNIQDFINEMNGSDSAAGANYNDLRGSQRYSKLLGIGDFDILDNQDDDELIKLDNNLLHNSLPSS